MIEFCNVTKYYDGFRALDDVSLRVGEGEIAVLVGPNGAGKSTMLRIAAGLLEPSSGTVRLGEGDGLPAERARRSVGYLPENAACYDELTARENLGYFCSLRGLRGRKLDERVEGLLRMVELAKETKLVRDFSKGMRQRLGIAVSLAGRPRVVLWDEPSSGLDPSGRLLLRDIIASLKKEGAAILVSSHDLRESALLADRVCLVHRGELRFQGRSDGPELEKLYSEVVG
ncbi:MAG: ABC transporter ATP-binding protein [Euryarchaeota archaeon]|nr:ABC transporter ATP-binding protein [Euryarchaeota archaeon]